MSILVLMISITLMYSTPLIFSTLGGVLTQRSGVDNIGLEGMMTLGAFAAATAGYFSGSPWIGFLAGGLAGALLALLHAFASITVKGNQIISGVALNFIGLGLAVFLTRIFFKGAAQTNAVTHKIPKLLEVLGIDKSHSPLLVSADLDMTVLLAFLATVILWFVLYRTRIGLRIRACGEHPAAADSMGISVTRIRYACVLLSGVLAGFGGAATTLAVVSIFTPTVISGQGFIALAAVIFGNWKPQGGAAACLLFGFAQALTVVLANVPYIPSQILAMLPYALTLVVLVLFVGRAVPPKADGQPYLKDES